MELRIRWHIKGLPPGHVGRQQAFMLKLLGRQLENFRLFEVGLYQWA
jgi:hypothetical protein